MSAQDLSRVHRRYISLSNTFKSAWTFHQFLQGLRKVFAESGLEVAYPADFQSLYTALKRVSENLNEATAPGVEVELGEIAERLDALTASLLAADAQVQPGLLRQFFQRVKNFDDNILGHLLKFYVYSHPAGTVWEQDRLDKADYVLTKLCEDYQADRDRYLPREAEHVRQVAEGLWQGVGGPEVTPERVAALRQELATFRQALATATSVDQLYSQNLVQRYRAFKHSLGDAFFLPQLVPELIDTNLALKNAIQDLYRREEQRIVAEYQQVFELEREVAVPGELRQELQAFREAVERFESRLQGSGVRLEELGQLREQVRELIPKLRSDVGDEADPHVVPPELRDSSAGIPTAPAADEEMAHLEPIYKELVAALDDTSSALEARKVVLQPEVFSYGIQPREVQAYRRIFGNVECNRALETFLLRAAALRVRIDREVEEIKSLLDDSTINRDAPSYGRARVSTRLGDLFVRRFEHLVNEAVVAGQAEDAKEMHFLKMRLTRTWAGLWLLVH